LGKRDPPANRPSEDKLLKASPAKEDETYTQSFCTPDLQAKRTLQADEPVAKESSSNEESEEDLS
jgi:hypothetical protein